MKIQLQGAEVTLPDWATIELRGGVVLRIVDCEDDPDDPADRRPALLVNCEDIDMGMQVRQDAKGSMYIFFDKEGER